MIQTFPCPDAARLRALLADTDLNDSDLQTHLAHCPRCQERLDEFAVGESGWLRDAGRLASTPVSDPEMTKTLHRLRDEWPDDGPPIALDFLKPSDQPGLLGTLGRYQVLEVIGRGAMGIVLKAIDPDLLRPVAIKVLAPYLATSGTARQRFLREARAAAAVSHDHIVTIHAVEPGDLPYIVMEFVSGISLQARLDRDGPLPPRDIARIGHQAACGLAAAHSVGLVHRDIKPANILLENGVERVKITDFGLARAADDARLTQSGTAAGTPLYMSPEQTRGEAVDLRADLFSLGSVLYTMATGFPPFRAGSTMGVLNRIANDPPRPIRETVPDFPAALEAIIMQLLEKDPARRFQLAADVSVRLSGFLADPRAEPRRRRRMPRWLEASLPVLAGILVLGTVLYFKTKQGTLIVEVDDPNIKVALDGREVKITGAGPQEIRLAPGEYHVTAMKDGKPVQAVPEVVKIERDGKQVVKVTAVAESNATGLADSDGHSIVQFQARIHEFLPDLDADSRVLMMDAISRTRPDSHFLPSRPGDMELNESFPKLQALVVEASRRDIDAGRLKRVLADARALADKIVADWRAAHHWPAAPKTAPKPGSEWDDKLKKLTDEFRSLTDRLSKTTVGRVLLVVPPGGSPDKLTDQYVSGFASRRLLALRDQFGLLVPQFQKSIGRWEKAKLAARDAKVRTEAGALSQVEADKAELEVKDAERALATEEQTLAGIVADLKKLADEIDRPADPEAEFRKVMEDRDAIVLRLVKTPVGRVLAVVNENQGSSEATVREAGVPNASIPIAQKLLSLRTKIDEQATQALAGLFDYHKAVEEKKDREPAARQVKIHTATIRSLIDDMTKIADEIAPVPVPPEAEFKKVMAEYDAIVLRLMDTPVGRVLALTPATGTYTNADIDAVVREGDERRHYAVALLELRSRILKQADLAKQALATRAAAQKDQADNPGKYQDQGLRTANEDLIRKNEHEAKVRITALRGLVGDLKKIADELNPPKK